MEKQVFQRDQTTWQLYFLLSFYGYLLNSLGPLTPYLRAEHNSNYTTAGYHFSLFAVGMLLAGISGELAVRKLGAVRTLWLSAVGTIPGVLMILFAGQVWVSLAGALLIGLLGTFILTTIPAALAQKYGNQQAAAFAEINAFASLASMAAPLIVGAFALSIFGWRAALVIPYILLLIFVFFYRKAIWSGLNAKHTAAADASKNQSGRLPFRYWVFWFGILLVVAVEFCMVFWCSDYLISSLALPTNFAVLSVSVFLGAMLISRWAGSLLLQRYRNNSIYNTALLLTMIGFLFFWLLPSVWLKTLGLLLTGLGVGNLYPVALAFAIQSVDAQLSETASARASLASGGAILVLPLLLGMIADQSGLKLAYGLVILLILGAFLLPFFFKNGVENEI